MLDYVKFYRIKSWYKNMGMVLIGILSAPNFDPYLAFVGALQVFLIQLHSFSMNDYYDNRIWGEENYVGKVVSEGTSLWFIRLLMIGPLLMALSLFSYSGLSTILLLLYSVLFYFYQGPVRLKNHWALSIPLNAIPLGFVLYAHPFLVLSSELTSAFIFFSVLFMAYISFFEIAHQIEHQDMETEVFSIIDRFDLKTSLIVAELFLLAPTVLGLALYFFGSLNLLIFSTATFFLIVRIVKIKELLEKNKNLDYLRRSWHKFYAAFEGTIYITILLFL